jgi:rhodanese-related sulfurtransferase
MTVMVANCSLSFALKLTNQVSFVNETVTTERRRPMTSAIEQHLESVRRGISIVGPADAARLAASGALLVDTRPVAQRAEFGAIPGAVAIERNVLEWRLDPTSEHRHPAAIDHRGPIVVFCQEGYSSSLAVASLTALGVPDVHDLGGGFDAWAAAGLPVEHS